MVKQVFMRYVVSKKGIIMLAPLVRYSKGAHVKSAASHSIRGAYQNNRLHVKSATSHSRRKRPYQDSWLQGI